MSGVLRLDKAGKHVGACGSEGMGQVGNEDDNEVRFCLIDA